MIGMGKGVYWDCQYESLEEYEPMCSQAIVDGAISTRISFRMVQRHISTPKASRAIALGHGAIKFVVSPARIHPPSPRPLVSATPCPLGSKADMCSAKGHVCLVPIATCAVQLGISALGQKRTFAPQFVGHL